MLQRLHDNSKGWVTWLIAIVVAVLFSLWGIENFLSGGRAEAPVIANIDGIEITEADVKRAMPQLSADQVEHYDAVKAEVSGALIDRAIMVSSARQAGFYVSDEQVDATIAQMPEFQEDGAFSRKRFERLLMQLGLTTEHLKQDVKNNMLANLFTRSLTETGFVTPTQLYQYIAMQRQKRQMLYVSVPNSYFKDVEISEQEAKAYYADHQEDFISDEAVLLDYITLERASFEDEAQYLETADQIAQIAFEQSGSLEELANTYGLQVHTSPRLSRNASTLTAPWNDATIQRAAFSEDLLSGNNSDLINISEEKSVILHLNHYFPAAPLVFEEARPAIVARLTTEKQKSLGRAFITESINTFKKPYDASLKAWAEKHELAFISTKMLARDDTSLPTPLLNRLFLTPTEDIGEVLTMEQEDDLVLYIFAYQVDAKELDAKGEERFYQKGLVEMYGQWIVHDLTKKSRMNADIHIQEYPK